MRIAVINSTHKWGGVKTWSLDNAEALMSLGHEVILYSRSGDFHDKACQKGIEAVPYSFGFDFNPLSIAYFWREFKKRNIDICVCNVSKDLRSAGIAARLLNIPIVQHLGATYDLKKSFRIYAVAKLLSPHFITPSAYVASYLTGHFPWLLQFEVKSIHPGVPIESRYQRTAIHSPRVITITARLSQNKGHDILLLAVAKLKKEGFRFQCRIVGSGRQEQNLRDLCKANDLEDVVIFTGFTTDVPSQLALSDIYVFPATKEGLGISLQEAMATGLPCIAKRGSGPDEIWPQDRPHMLIPEDDDSTELHLQLKRLLEMDDKELLAEGCLFYQNACQKFDRITQAKELTHWFENIIENSHN